MNYDIVLDDLLPQDTAVFRGHVAMSGIGDFLGLAFRQVMGALGVQSPEGAPFARYAMVDGGFDVEAGFPVEAPFEGTGQVVASTLPGGPVAMAMHRGSYLKLAAAYTALEQWLGANGYESAGDPWETYLDEPTVDEPRTVVSWPCRRTS